MSFEWNLSSSEGDDDDLEDWTRKQGFLGNNESEAATLAEDEDRKQAASSLFTSVSDEDEDEEEDDDQVDWEDAAGEDEPHHNATTNSANDQSSLQATIQPVTIDLNDGNTEKTVAGKRKRAKRRNKFRLESLPGNMRSLLWSLHRSHLLALTSRAVGLSERASDPELLAVAYSLIPEHLTTETAIAPTLSQLNDLAVWYFDLVHGVEQRRERQYQANLAAGAGRGMRRGRRQRSTTATGSTDSLKIPCQTRLLEYAAYLSETYNDDPQLAPAFDSVTALDILLLFLAMTRSLGWRTRCVQAMDTVPLDLTVHHPLLLAGPLFAASANQIKDSPSKKSRRTNIEQTDSSSPDGPGVLNWVEVLCSSPSSTGGKRRWIHVDPVHQLVNQPQQVQDLWKHHVLESSSGRTNPPLSYVVAVEHAIGGNTTGDNEKLQMRLTDVTPRYATSWIESLRQRGQMRGKTMVQPLENRSNNEKNGPNSWWSDTLNTINQYSKHQQDVSQGTTVETAICLDDSDDSDKKPAAVTPDTKSNLNMDDHHDQLAEEQELQTAAENEAIPTSKAAFQSHPLYVIPSVLGVAQVLAPDAKKRICGVFKGELVYKRSDVSTALPARRWPYQGRKVKDGEKPVKRIKARKKPASKSFRPLKSYGVGETNDGSLAQREQVLTVASQPLDDGMEHLFAIWQTDPWSPPRVGPTDPIPVNEFKNVELELLNPGLVHIDVRGAAKVAKQLAIPYAPCLLGFEGHGGNRTPTIRGIVVHQHNQDIIREAMSEVTQFEIATEQETRRQGVLAKWKKLMVGLLTKDRLEREYGDD